MALGIVIELDTGALLLYGIPFIIIVGWFSSRILGVHRGWGRSFFAGFMGWIFGVSIAAVVQTRTSGTRDQLNDVLLLAFFFGLLDLDVRRADPRRRPEAEVTEASPVRPDPAPDQDGQAEVAPLGRSREILRYARKRGLTHYASAVEAGHAGVRSPACGSRSRTAAACS